MSGPFEPLAQMARQLGNMGELLGEDFWSQSRVPGSTARSTGNGGDPPPRSRPGPGGQGLALQRERVTGYLHRAVRLPVPVESAGARARYVDGILEIRLVRAETGGGDGAVSLLRVEAPNPA